jgi:hypothetical protein
MRQRRASLLEERLNRRPLVEAHRRRGARHRNDADGQDEAASNVRLDHGRSPWLRALQTSCHRAWRGGARKSECF